MLLIAALAGIVAGAALGLALAIGRDLPHVEALEDFEPSAATTILAADGTVLARLFVEKRLPVPLNQVPPALVDAIIAVEDHRFYQHPGLDVIRVFGALYADLKAGRLAQGASTITQQLARNLFLTREKTLARKLRELFLSFQVEQRYSKDEILEFYLNQIYLGAGAFGVGAAAQTYFGKSPGELTLGECALLAGLPRSPEGYSPFRHPDRALRRRNIVLRAMVREGYLTREKADAAAAEPLDLVSRAGEQGPAPYFAAHVRRQLVERFGENQVYRGGMVVTTTLDPGLQAAAQSEATAAGKDRLQAAIIVLETGRGAIRAWVGGTDFAASSFDRVEQARHVPGAAFLPIIYAAAIDSGMSQADTIWDAPAGLPSTGAESLALPGYRGALSRGEITLRQALAESAEAPAVRLLNRIGPDYAIAAARRLGITTELPHSPALALGSMEVNLFELAGAYNALAGGGMHVEPYGIMEVRDAAGVVLYRTAPKRRKALEAETSAIVTDMLGGPEDLGRPSAGKAGFNDNMTYAMYVGYTPGLLAAVWVGHDQESTTDEVSAGPERIDSSTAGNLWTDLMKTALIDTDYEDFPLPLGVVMAPMDRYTGRPAEPEDPAFVMAAFREGRAPGASSTD